MHYSEDPAHIAPAGNEDVCPFCKQRIEHVRSASPQDEIEQEDSALDSSDSLSNRKGGEIFCTPPLQERDSKTISNPALGRLRSSYRNLTAREEQVARLAAQGFSNVEIAKRLSAKVPTIKSHLQNVFAKADIRRRSQLVILFTPSVASAESK